MSVDLNVVLDACVLVPASLRDTLLRLAEKRLFLPRWSDEIVAEMVRTLRQKLQKTPEQTAHLTHELRTHFGEAWVENYEQLIASCTNHEKDRHVLAAAIRCNAEMIVTYNLRHFSELDLASWDIAAVHPDDFLIDLFLQDSDLITHTLREQAEEIGKNLKAQLKVLNAGLPKFVALISKTLHIDIE